MSERRIALKVIAGAAGAGAVAAAALPVARFVTAPGLAEDTAGADWKAVARFDALEVDRPVKANVTGTEIDAWTVAPNRRLGAVWLIRDAADSVRAYSVVCPHLGCGIEPAREGFVCPCHDSGFSLQGARQGGPSPRGMDSLACRVTDGRVEVRFQKFRLGVPEKIVIG